MARTAFHGRLDLLLRASQAQAAATEDNTLVSLVSKATGKQQELLGDAIAIRIDAVTKGLLAPMIAPPPPPERLSLRAHFILNRLAQVRAVLLDKEDAKGSKLVAHLKALQTEGSTSACLDYLEDHKDIADQFKAVFDPAVFNDVLNANLESEELRAAIGERLKALAALEAHVTEHVQGNLLRASRGDLLMEKKTGSRKTP